MGGPPEPAGNNAPTPLNGSAQVGSAQKRMCAKWKCAKESCASGKSAKWNAQTIINLKIVRDSLFSQKTI